MPADVPSETEQEGDARERFEAEATRRFPGVEFWWSNGERRARLRGSGIEVWEAIRALEDLGWDFDRALRMWPHITRDLLMDAVGFYRTWPDPDDRRIGAARAFERAHRAGMALAEERARYSA